MMRRRQLLLVLAGASSQGLTACTPRPAPTDRAAGTPQPGEGGIGGTGAMADVPGPGVFGIITGFGSIDVNGLQITLPRGLPVDTLAAVSLGRELMVGDTVAIATAQSGQSIVARHITRVVPLVGAIEAAHGRTLQVMRTRVVLPGESALRKGDWVEVSGLWRSGSVVASHVERILPQARASISGLLREVGNVGLIGGTTIGLDCCTRPSSAGFAVISGTYRDGRLVAEHLASGAALLFAPTVRRLVVEAFLARNPDDSGYHLSGFGIPMNPASTVPPVVGRRSIFEGQYDGSFLIERSRPWPASDGERPRLE